jgi:hypothetical protein
MNTETELNESKPADGQSRLNAGLGNERIKMNIPVDEMLSELRDILEQFDNEPTFTNFDKIQKETMRIERACEDAAFLAL